jgi:DNA polymerase-3 subunit beta
MEFTFAEGKVVVVGQGAEFGEARVELPIAYDHEPLTVIFDPRFLMEFFRVLDPEVVCTMEIGDPEKAVLFSTSDGYAYVVMPLSRDRGGW